MFLLKLGVALAIIVACVVLMFRLHRQLKGESSLGLKSEGARQPRADSNELEQFIAAYRREKALGAASPATSSGPTASPALAPASSPAPVAAPLAAAPSPELNGTARNAFLAGPAKLAFFVLRAGLPDHLVFANTRVSDLLDDNGASALSNLKIDLLVCDKELAIVAAIDVDGGPAGEAAERQKQQSLQAAGIRYLRFAPGAIPKPTEVRRVIFEQ